MTKLGITKYEWMKTALKAEREQGKKDELERDITSIKEDKTQLAIKRFWKRLELG